MTINAAAIDQELASQVFDQALYLKPRLHGETGRHQTLAPLIAIGVSNANQELWQLLPLDLDVNYLGTTLETRLKPRLALYWHQDQDRIGDTPRTRVTYVWFEWDDRLHTPTGGMSVSLPYIAISITLNKSGAPMIVRVLEHSWFTRSEQYFVTQAVEMAAGAEFGPPAEGRTYSVESAGDASPIIREEDSIGPFVPRLLAEGPEASGPWIYLDGNVGMVTTVLCRCSPSQVKSFVETREYDLRPLPELPRKIDGPDLSQPSSAGLRLPKALP